VGAGTGLGNIVFAVLAVTLWGNAEFLVFMMVIGMLLLTWGYTFLTVKETPPAHNVAVAEIPLQSDLPPVTRTRRTLSDRWALIKAYVRGLLQYPEAAKYAGAMMFWWLGTGGVVPFVTLFAVKVLGASTEESFFLPLAAVGATALFSVPAGYLADRTSKKAVMIVGMIAFGLVALVGSQSQVMWQGIVAMALAGAANGCLSMINAQVSDLVPQKRMAEFMGLASSIFSLAQPLGSVIAGAVVGVVLLLGQPEQEAYRWAFIVAGIMTITSALLLRTVHPERVIKTEAADPA
jgi:Na+/melibiose symporter-like transporter